MEDKGTTAFSLPQSRHREHPCNNSNEERSTGGTEVRRQLAIAGEDAGMREREDGEDGRVKGERCTNSGSAM